MGTEFNLALTYRFAPGLVLDWAAGYMMTDSALSHRFVGADYNVQAPVRKDIGVQPIAITTARVRFSF
jgi:methylthioribose-1-phosphate isomerase